MRIKQFRTTSLFGISLAICALLFVACDSDNSAFPDLNLAPVSGVELSVDKANFTGTCPHTFKFSGVVTSSGAGTVPYTFRYPHDDFDTIIAVGSLQFSSAASQTVPLELVLTESGTREVLLHAGSTNLEISNSVQVTATCN